MHPTQSGKACHRGWLVCGKQQGKGKQERFTALLHHLTVELLRDSFYALKRNAAPGVDGVRWQEYETDWRIGSSICTAGFTGSVSGAALKAGLFRRPTDGNVRWASRRWRTKSFNRPW